MKNWYGLLFALVLLLTSCNSTPTATQIPPTAVVVQVTRLVQITTTPLPEKTSTPTPTLSLVDQSATAVVERLGTPIVANTDCYQTAMTQSAINGCAGSGYSEMQEHMKTLIDDIKNGTYYAESKEDLQKFLKFQSEWEDFVERECAFEARYTIVDGQGFYEGGSMAPANYYGCLTDRYEQRLRQLQRFFYFEQ